MVLGGERVQDNPNADIYLPLLPCQLTRQCLPKYLIVSKYIVGVGLNKEHRSHRSLAQSMKSKYRCGFKLGVPQSLYLSQVNEK